MTKSEYLSQIEILCSTITIVKKEVLSLDQATNGSCGLITSISMKKYPRVPFLNRSLSRPTTRSGTHTWLKSILKIKSLSCSADPLELENPSTSKISFSISCHPKNICRLKWVSRLRHPLCKLNKSLTANLTKSEKDSTAPNLRISVYCWLMIWTCQQRKNTAPNRPSNWSDSILIRVDGTSTRTKRNLSRRLLILSC